MGVVILKATPDRDLYCIWSSVVDQPTMLGTRSDVTEDLGEHEMGPRGCTAWHPDEIDSALRRADETGTSSVRGYGNWGDPALMVAPGKSLRRDRLGSFLDALDSRWYATGELPETAIDMLKD